MSELVWYAAYGSNLRRARFCCYLAGGTPEGGSWQYPRCSDPRPPRDSRPVRLPYRLYFAGASRTWGGGMAFLDHHRDESLPTLGRAYLITAEQLGEVFAQENRASAVALDLALVSLEGRCTVGNGNYADLVSCGTHDGVPVITFTASSAPAPALAAPAAAYLRTVAAGLSEAHGLDHDATLRYLAALDGVHLRYTRDDLDSLLAGVALRP